MDFVRRQFSAILRQVVLALFVSVALTSPAFAKPFASCVFGYGAANFVPETATVWGIEFKYRRVPQSRLRQRTLPASALGSDSTVFIGIDTDGHMYEVAGSFRHDGKLLFLKPVVRESSLLTEGLVIALDDGTGQLKRS